MQDDFKDGSGRSAAVLIVEDDGELGKVLGVRLRREGYECEVVHSSAQAISAWQQRSYDLVISDVNMPNGDGVALAEVLQRSEAVPIVFITGFRDDFDRRLRSVSNATILEKPFDTAVLFRLIDRLLDGKAKGDDGIRHRASVGID